MDVVYTLMRTFGFMKKAEGFLLGGVNCSFSRKTVSHGVSSGTSDLGSTEANVIS
jgi:hypothetical protein